MSQFGSAATLIPAFLKRYADVDIQLICTDRHVDLIDDDVDLVIRIESKPSLGLVARELMPVNYVLCAAADYLAQAGTPLTPLELSTHSGLFFGNNPGDGRWNLMREHERATISVRGRFIINHSEAMLEAVMAGVRIGFMPYFTARSAIARKAVIQLFPEWKLVSRYQGTAWLLSMPNRHLPPKVRVLLTTSFPSGRDGEDEVLHTSDVASDGGSGSDSDGHYAVSHHVSIPTSKPV